MFPLTQQSLMGMITGGTIIPIKDCWCKGDPKVQGSERDIPAKLCGRLGSSTLLPKP